MEPAPQTRSSAVSLIATRRDPTSLRHKIDRCGNSERCHVPLIRQEVRSLRGALHWESVSRSRSPTPARAGPTRSACNAVVSIVVEGETHPRFAIVTHLKPENDVQMPCLTLIRTRRASMPMRYRQFAQTCSSCLRDISIGSVRGSATLIARVRHHLYGAIPDGESDSHEEACKSLGEVFEERWIESSTRSPRLAAWSDR